MTQLNGKVFVITGSGDGIGRTTAQVAAQKGAHIIVNDLNPDAAEETAKLIKNDGGKADHFQLDVTDRDAVGVFLPQVKFVKAYASNTKQNWVIELISGNESVKLGMTIRSSSGGKLKQWSLKVTYNGLLK